MQIGKDKNQRLYDAPELEVRPCDHPGCRNAGEHRAPKGRERLREYYWFCLDHVRDYNRAWNFYAGLSEAEVELLTRNDAVWNRPSWPLGSWAAREEELRQQAAGMAGDDPDAAADDARRRWQRSQDPRTPRDDTETALAELDLSPPVAFETVKARYKTLVKQHHPDTNGGSKVAEEKLKSINRAYGVLKAAFGR